MVALGVLTEEDHTELLYGTLVEMSPQKPEHAYAVQRLNQLLTLKLAGRAQVYVQSPLAAGPDSEPEPDLMVLPPGDYAHHHPSRALLVVEVAESTIKKDRTIKGWLYCEAGVEEYWLVNLIDSVVEVHREIMKDAYSRVTHHGRGDFLRLKSFPDVEVSA
jgi:Uma2 family endonuclease